MTSSSEFKVDISTVSSLNSRSLLTRDQAAGLRDGILQLLGIHSSVILDMGNVVALSPSFADELFGGLETALGDQFRRKIRILCPRAEWKRLIAGALAHRLEVESSTASST